MVNNDSLYSRPNYLLKKYQNEIFRQLVNYMEKNNLTQKDVATRLGVSSTYVNQVLNGNFNFTLKKLIEIGLMIGKVPALEFIDREEFIKREDKTVNKLRDTSPSKRKFTGRKVTPVKSRTNR